MLADEIYIYGQAASWGVLISSIIITTRMK